MRTRQLKSHVGKERMLEAQFRNDDLEDRIVLLENHLPGLNGYNQIICLLQIDDGCRDIQWFCENPDCIIENKAYAETIRSFLDMVIKRNELIRKALLFKEIES